MIHRTGIFFYQFCVSNKTIFNLPGFSTQVLRLANLTLCSPLINSIFKNHRNLSMCVSFYDIIFKKCKSYVHFIISSIHISDHNNRLETWQATSTVVIHWGMAKWVSTSRRPCLSVHSPYWMSLSIQLYLLCFNLQLRYSDYLAGNLILWICFFTWICWHEYQSVRLSQ